MRQTRRLCFATSKRKYVNCCSRAADILQHFSEIDTTEHTPKVTATCAVQRSGLLTGRQAMLTCFQVVCPPPLLTPDQQGWPLLVRLCWQGRPTATRRAAETESPRERLRRGVGRRVVFSCPFIPLSVSSRESNVCPAPSVGLTHRRTPALVTLRPTSDIFKPYFNIFLGSSVFSSESSQHFRDCWCCMVLTSTVLCLHCLFWTRLSKVLFPVQYASINFSPPLHHQTI